MTPIFLRTCNYTYNELYVYHRHILYKVQITFHKVSSIINTFFSPLRETLYAGTVKLYSEASQLFRKAVLQVIVVSKTASSEFILQGDEKTGQNVQYQKCQVDKDLIQRPLWPKTLNSLVFFNFLNICTYRSELILTPVYKNSTNIIPPLSQKTRAMTLLAEVCILKFYPSFSLQSRTSTFHFLPFGPLKNALRGRPFEDGDELKHSVHGEFRPFSSFTLPTYTV